MSEHNIQSQLQSMFPSIDRDLIIDQLYEFNQDEIIEVQLSIVENENENEKENITFNNLDLVGCQNTEHQRSFSLSRAIENLRRRRASNNDRNDGNKGYFELAQHDPDFQCRPNS